jgi:hypothetical protein
MAIMGAIRRGTSRRVNLGAIRTLGASHLLQEIGDDLPKAFIAHVHLTVTAISNGRIRNGYR